MSDFWATIMFLWDSIPDIVRALIVLVLGILAAIGLRFIVWKFFQLIRFDALCERTGFAEFLRKGKARHSPSKLIGVIVFWLVLIAFMLITTRIINRDLYLGIAAVISSAVPRVLGGIFVMIVGYLVVSFLANFARTIALNASFSGAIMLSRLIRWLGIAIVVSVGLQQMGLGQSMIEYVFNIVVAAIALGLALAFGLGSKDIARDYLQRLLHRIKEKERAGHNPDLEG